MYTDTDKDMDTVKGEDDQMRTSLMPVYKKTQPFICGGALLLNLLSSVAEGVLEALHRYENDLLTYVRFPVVPILTALD